MDNDDNISSISSSTIGEKGESLNNTKTTSINKVELISIIRDWVKNDNEIRELKKQENIRKASNKILNNKLIEIMRSNQLDCFDINDGCILYKKTNVKKTETEQKVPEPFNNPLLGRRYSRF